MYNGWFGPMPFLVRAMVAQQLFQAKPSNILLTTIPKSGTTWLKSLLFSTVNRNSTSYDPRHCLATLNPHECVPFIEFQVHIKDQVPNLDLLPSLWFFATHIPFHVLPDSVIRSGCKIVYLCRDPKDTFISLWKFVNKINSTRGRETLALEKALDMFCKGFSVAGPFWDHMLGYWDTSLKRPEQVIFMKYEFMKDPIAELKRLAEFIGCPFTLDENRDGVEESIVNLCSFKNLSRLEVNKGGKTGIVGFDNNMFFRQGATGDWVNHLTPEMAQRLDKIKISKIL